MKITQELVDKLPNEGSFGVYPTGNYFLTRKPGQTPVLTERAIVYGADGTAIEIVIEHDDVSISEYEREET